MGWATAFQLALDSLRAHKLRTFLTLLGVIIGVSSVVIVGAAIEGLGVYADQTTSKVFGSDSFLISQLAQLSNLSRMERLAKLRRNKPIKTDEVDYLRTVTGDRLLYSPYTQRVDDVKFRDTIFEAASILGVSSTLPEIREVVLTEGRFFTEQEERSNQMVAVVGDELRETLFPDRSPVGNVIKLRGYDFQIVGVQEKLGSSGARTRQDNPVYIPSTVYFKIFGEPRNGFGVFAKARPETGANIDEALDLVRAALRIRFKPPPGADDNFDILTPDAIRAFVDSLLALVSAIVIPVTAISLVVGGIVIMNIMLVSVTERTREIGVRKSLGARQRDIMLQFLIESVLMSAIGGSMGLMLGWALVAVTGRVIELDIRVGLPFAVLAIFVSTAVGIVSGWYPARRAARMDPVEALRAE